jgi:hypothetical protein
MILDNLLRYRQAQSAPFGLSVAHKWLKNGILNRWGDAGAVIPDADLQAGSISGRGYHDPPRVGRNRLACVQQEVGDHPLEKVGIEPAHGQAFMMMLDSDSTELLFHSCHADCALDCVNDVSDGGPKSVTIPGALKQRSDQFIHPLDGPTDFLVKVVPFCLADI